MILRRQSGSFLLLLFLLVAVSNGAQASEALLGSWKTERSFVERGEKHREIETLRFLPGSFRFTLRADIEKGNYVVKGLTLEATGLWKREGDLLVLVMQEIRFVGVDETRGIDPSSYKRLIINLREKYLSDPIRLYHITSEDNGTLTLQSRKAGLKSYKRSE